LTTLALAIDGDDKSVAATQVDLLGYYGTGLPILSTLMKLYTAYVKGSVYHEKAVIDHLSSEDDMLVQKLWPVRARGDLPLRRSRFRDLYLIAKARGQLSILTTFLKNASKSLDYITVLVIGYASIIYGLRWLTFWINIGALSGSAEHWSTVSKQVSSHIKSFSQIDINVLPYVEAQSLTGYRSLPFPGFDPTAETKAWANSGITHLYPKGWSFTQSLSVLAMTPRIVKPCTFAERVMSEDWSTSGASSRGRLEFKHGGEQYSIKARKNFLFDVEDPSKLISDIKEGRYKGQVNVAFAKSETGKVRLAVASDIETFAIMDYFGYYLSDSYKDWPFSTLEDTFSIENSRLIELLNVIRQTVSLPFDYASCDHQQTTVELKMICEVICDQAILNADAAAKLELMFLKPILLSSFDTSTVTINDGSERSTFDVKGGLMSGLRWTSLLTNAWNLVMTNSVLTIVKGCGVPLSSFKAYIRGDDCAIQVGSVVEAQLCELAFRRIGVLGGNGKFGIKQGATEFLRVWISDRCYRYPNRAMIGLVQRKPWTPEPWTPSAQLAALFQTVSTLERRHCDTSQLFNIFSRVWSRKNKLPFKMISIPRCHGGLGLGDWDQSSVVVGRIPPTTYEFKSSLPTSSYRLKKILDKGKQLGYEITETMAANIAKKRLASILSTDDIPQISKILRDEFRSSKKDIFIMKKTFVPKYGPIPNIQIDAQDPDSVQNFLATLPKTTFGSKPQLQARLEEHRPYLAELSISISSWLAIKGGARTINEIDWLSGVLPMNESNINPNVISVRNRIMVTCLSVLRNGRSLAEQASCLQPIVEAALKATAWYQQVWMN